MTMIKPQGRTMLRIKDLYIDTGKIEYYEDEVFKDNPLEGLKKKYTPIAKQRLFIYPDSNIPRFKLKAFCDKHKISIAKAKETADVFFMHPDTANDGAIYYDYEFSTTFMHRQYFLDYLKKATKVGDVRYVKLISDLANHPDSAIILQDTYTFQNHGIGKYKLDIVEPGDTDDNNNELVPNCEDNGRRTKIYTMSAEQKANFALLEGKDIYHSDALLALLNDGGTVIDEEMYQGVNNLFNSNDTHDHRVAMEAMANCDYQKSAVYLLMLFYYNHKLIYNCDSKTHVNFKSFLKFFNLNATRGIDIDDIIERLKDKKLLTRSNLNIVMAKAKELLDESATNVSTYFVPTGIAPIEEIIKEVEETDSLQTPAIPVADPMTETQITDL